MMRCSFLTNLKGRHESLENMYNLGAENLTQICNHAISRETFKRTKSHRMMACKSSKWSFPRNIVGKKAGGNLRCKMKNFLLGNAHFGLRRELEKRWEHSYIKRRNFEAHGVSRKHDCFVALALMPLPQCQFSPRFPQFPGIGRKSCLPPRRFLARLGTLACMLFSVGPRHPGIGRAVMKIIANSTAGKRAWLAARQVGRRSTEAKFSDRVSRTRQPLFTTVTGESK